MWLAAGFGGGLTGSVFPPLPLGPTFKCSFLGAMAGFNPVRLGLIGGLSRVLTVGLVPVLLVTGAGTRVDEEMAVRC